MTGIWDGFSGPVQDALLLIALLLPLAVIAVFLNRGFAIRPLLAGLLYRYRWINATFVLLIAISVGMGIGLVSQERALRVGTAAAADKFDLVVGAPGSELTLMLASVYLEPSPIPLLGGDVMEALSSNNAVAFAAPLGFGDSHQGAPIVGTTEALVTHMADGALTGRMWQTPFEALAGASAAVEIGDQFTPAHGVGDAAEEGLHADVITVVGRLPPTGSPWDKAIAVPIEGVWLTHGLSSGRAPRDDDQIILGPPYDADYFPGTPAIVVRGKNLPATYALQGAFHARDDTMAIFPGTQLANLYGILGDIRAAMTLMASVTQVLVAVAVLTGLFVLTRLFARQLALLRVLGAPRRFNAALLWSYSALLLATGALLGILFGLIAAATLSAVVAERTNVAIVARLGWHELHLTAGFLLLSAILSLVIGAVSLPKRRMEALRD